jgi:hypothetical protein
MNVELVVALISAAVALASAGLAIWGQTTSARLAAELQNLRAADDRRHEREKAVSRYREPLARAAYDLQSRLYNILKLGLIQRFHDDGTDRERSYVLNSSIFLFAQYFAWTEIIRRDIQYIDLGIDAETARLARLQDNIYSLWQTDKLGPIFRVFAGEQRAIGERMIRDASRGPECIGYVAFLELNRKNEDDLLTALKEDVGNYSKNAAQSRPRLIALQNAMIDLLEFLDPGYVRFSKERRSKVPVEKKPVEGLES